MSAARLQGAPGGRIQMGRRIMSNTRVYGTILKTLRSATNHPCQRCRSCDTLGRDEQAAHSPSFARPHALDSARHQHAREQFLRVPGHECPRTGSPLLSRDQTVDGWLRVEDASCQRGRYRTLFSSSLRSQHSTSSPRSLMACPMANWSGTAITPGMERPALMRS